METLNKEINVDELLKATNDAIPICQVGVMRPVYSMNACGQAISCAMSSVDRQQGFINGIAYCSASFNNGGINNVAIGFRELPSIQGCCAIIYPTAHQVIDVPPHMSKG